MCVTFTSAMDYINFKYNQKEREAGVVTLPPQTPSYLFGPKRRNALSLTIFF